MADLHKFTVQESLNASQGHAGGWSVKDKQTINTAASATTKHHPLDSATTIILLQPTVDMQFSFTVAETDVNANNDLHLPGDVLTSLVVPRNLGSTINLNYIGKSNSGILKIVEV
tara:strand:- start:1394 stop:1738 length:345 start_codon:yes stop_codon:yes gene_type:complete